MMPFTSSDGEGRGSVDLRTLRAVRVLRPLKLVSGIPSKIHIFYNCACYMILNNSFCNFYKYNLKVFGIFEHLNSYNLKCLSLQDLKFNHNFPK